MSAVTGAGAAPTVVDSTTCNDTMSISDSSQDKSDKANCPIKTNSGGVSRFNAGQDHEECESRKTKPTELDESTVKKNYFPWSAEHLPGSR